jgi:3-oxoadipate enol-lactonase
MPRARINGTELYYEEHGSGPAVVFVHGGGGNHLSWWQQVPIFSSAYRCITYDQRGYGQSEPTGVDDPAVLGRDLAALLDHLRVDRALLVAQSLGGWAIWGLAQAQPQRVRALVMADTPGGVPAPEVAQWFGKMGERAQRGENVLANAIYPRLRETQPALHFLYWQIQALNPPPTPQSSGLLGRLARRPQAADLSAFSIPTLFIVGEQDEMIPPTVLAAAAAAVPGARLLRVPDAGHSVYFEKPAEFNAAVLEFFREVEKREQR